MVFQRAIQVIEKIKGVVGVIFPGILAVQNDTDNRGHVWLRMLMNLFQLTDEVRGGILAMPALVLKADQIRQPVVAEEAMQSMTFAFDDIGPIQEMVMVDGNAGLLQGIPQYRFAARSPFHLCSARSLRNGTDKAPSAGQMPTASASNRRR